ELSVKGEVEESALFFGQMRLTTTYTTVPGSNRVVITDRIDNRGARPVEMQLLYHVNLGPPFLEAGSRVLMPIRELAPLTPRAAEARGGDRHIRNVRPADAGVRRAGLCVRTRCRCQGANAGPVAECNRRARRVSALAGGTAAVFYRVEEHDGAGGGLCDGSGA